MLYILEGCDGAGKTTVANQLKEILDAEIIHCSQYTPNTTSYFLHLADAAKDRNIIADRFCYGQFVYQEEEDRPMADKATPISDRTPALENLHKLESLMLSKRVKVIYVTAPAEVIKDRLALRGESLINELTVEEILVKYETIKNLSILPWITWNTGGEE